MRVRAKMRCGTVTNREHASDVELNAVHSATGENADFADATPSGKLTLTISKGRPAIAAFTPGTEYYVEIEAVPPKEAKVE